MKHVKKGLAILTAALLSACMVFPALAAEPDIYLDGSGFITGIGSWGSDSLTFNPTTEGGDAINGYASGFLKGHDNIKHITINNDGDFDDDAFLEALGVEDYTIGGSSHYALEGAGIRLSNFLVDYPSAAAKTNFTLSGSVDTVLSMDNAKFGTLDLSNATEIAYNALCGTYADTLTVGASAQTGYDGGLIGLTLKGLHAKNFAVTGTGSLKAEAGGKVLTDGTRIVKIASGYTGDLTAFSGYTIDHNAFDSIAQAEKLWDKGAKDIAGKTVFNFYGQEYGVFFYNGKITYCYNYGDPIPSDVNSVADYDETFGDADTVKKINALMYAGVPSDKAGIFKDVFGVTYEQSQIDCGSAPNPALNVVSVLVWETVDGSTKEIEGIGSTSYFTDAKISEYRSRLETVIANADKYNFVIVPSVDVIGMTDVGGEFVSDSFSMVVKDKAGNAHPEKVMSVHFADSSVKVNGSAGASFNTGDTITLTCATNPTALDFVYETDSLSYGTPTDTTEQHVLIVNPASAKGDVLTFSRFKISKTDAATSAELPGATLQIIDPGTGNVFTYGGVTYEHVSTAEPWIVSIPDGSYILRETIAPEGYKVATDIPFTVASGTVPGGKIEMKDEVKPEEPTTPAPTEPEPTTPAPTEPEPTTPAPTEPEPTSPAPEPHYEPVVQPTTVEPTITLPEEPVQTVETVQTGDRLLVPLAVVLLVFGGTMMAYGYSRKREGK